MVKKHFLSPGLAAICYGVCMFFCTITTFAQETPVYDLSISKHETAIDYLITSLKGSAKSALTKDLQKRPNILFIAIDDLRPELGTYGAKYIQSSNIDMLASQGVQFNKAYCQSPHCAPSRSSLLSGVHTIGYDGTPMKPEELAPGKLTLPATFRRAGYYTIGNGKIFHQKEDDEELSWSEPSFSLVNGPKENNHLTFHDKESVKYILEKNKRGPFFEAPNVPDNTYIDGQTCDKTIEDLQRLAKKYEPFFLACGFVRPHLPFYVPKKYWDKYDREEIAVAENQFNPKNAPDALTGSREFASYHDRDIEYNSQEFHKIARHGYYASITYVDALVGRLLTTLDELGLRENTIVVLWGDHGWNLGEHNYWSKHNLLNTSKHTPLIIRAPGFKQDVKADGIVELVDIYPTLCELAGISLPQHLEGNSIVSLMKNPKQDGKKAAYTKWRSGASVITSDFSYTEWDSNQRKLFDLKKDPNENENVAEIPIYTEIVKEMKELLRQKKL